MKIFPSKKFQVKIIRVLMYIGIIPLVVIAVSSLLLVIQTRKQNIVELQKLAMDNVSDKTLKYLNEKMEGFNLVVSGSSDANQAVSELIEINPNALLFLLKSVKDTSGDVKRIDFISREGDIIARINEDESFLITDYYDTNTVLGYNFVNKVSSIGKVAERDDFKTAISGQDYLGSLEQEDGGPVIRLASQIENEKREIIGVISAVVKLDSLVSLVQKVNLGETGYIYLLDKEKNLIASSNQNLKNSNLLIDNEKIKDVILNGKKYGVYDYIDSVNFHKEKVAFSGRQIEGMEWYVFSEWPVHNAFQVINNILMLIVGVALGVLLFIIILSIFMARQIVKPIKILSEGALEISKGNLDYKINLKTDDEFENLAYEFNQMIKILKENKKLKDEFVFIASHELRTPVTAISGYLEMIMDGSFGEIDSKIVDKLDIIKTSNNRLIQLVHDLLEVARSEAGRMKIEVKPIDIKKSINDTIVELKSLADKKNIKVKYNENFSDVDVEADEGKLKEVLVNIIGNSIKYTEDDGDIEIYHEKKGDYLVTHIKDHGIGMKKEDVEKLFSKFYRVQNEKTVNIKGTGLGLFISKEIVERMGGEIWVKSTYGEGSVFSFKLKVS